MILFFPLVLRVADPRFHHCSSETILLLGEQYQRNINQREIEACEAQKFLVLFSVIAFFPFRFFVVDKQVAGSTISTNIPPKILQSQISFFQNNCSCLSPIHFFFFCPPGKYH